MLIAFESIPNELRGWGSMRPTKCYQGLEGNRTLLLGVRGQNEGTIVIFGCDPFFD